jgi:hypothetical protein
MNEESQTKAISRPDLAALGSEQIAYIKPIVTEESRAFSVHAADGTQLTVVETREIAEAILRQHELAPVSVH